MNEFKNNFTDQIILGLFNASKIKRLKNVFHLICESKTRAYHITFRRATVIVKEYATWQILPSNIYS